MKVIDTLSQTVIDIYSAPGSAAGWDAAIESINKLVGGKASAYFLVNNEDHSAQINANHGLPRHVVDAYQLKGPATDIRFQYMHNLIPGKVFREFEFVTNRAEWDASEWIQYQYNEIGIYYGMAAKVSTHGLWSDFIAVNRLKTRGQHTDREKSNLQFLLPHLSRAAELHRWVSDLESRYSAVLSVLDKLLVGLVILDKRGRIAVINKAALETRDASGAFTFTLNGHFRIVEDHIDRSFKRLLSHTGETRGIGEKSDGGQLIVKNRSTGGELLLEIMPIRDDGFSDSDNIQGTAIFIMDPARSQFISTEGLSNIFKLTQSEAEVTRSLINGLSINDISDLRNTRVETVRGQLKTVLSKTGAKSQLDLIRLAVKANPPIEKES